MLLLPVAVFIFGTAASAQSIRDVARQAASTDSLGHGFAAMGVLGSSPGISGATYDSDMRITSTKLPISHTFGRRGVDDPKRVLLRGELTISRVAGKQSLPFLGFDGPEKIRLRYRSWTAIAGLGPEIPLATDLLFRPVATIGYTRVTGTGRADGVSGQLVLDQTRGILSGVKTHAALYGSAVELDYDHRGADGIRWRGKARFSFLLDRSSRESDPSLRSRGLFGVATVNGEISGPMGHVVLGRSVRWLAFAKATKLDGDADGLLGFDSFGEIGGGFELMRPIAETRLRGVQLRGSYIRGGNVTGWTAGIGFDL